MPLTILSVAYPFAAVGPDAAGGAEQVLAALDHALVAAGHRSIVVAAAGSRVAGTLVAVRPPCGLIDAAAKAAAHARHRRAIAAALAHWPVDLVHLHGVDFDCYLPSPGVAVLVSLHLPPGFYPEAALAPQRPLTFLHCVSASQHADLARRLPGLLPPIENGVDVEAFALARARRGFALVITRICPEKGVHLAIGACRRAGVPLMIAGQVFPYREHQNYFTEMVQPRLDRRCRFIGPVGRNRKRRLLAAARCVLIPSLVPETSSLVAREALAAGTPVIAFPAGALAETIADGATGFLVADAAQMAAAIPACATISAEHCRAVARDKFSHRRMVQEYLATYAALANAPVRHQAAAS